MLVNITLKLSFSVWRRHWQEEKTKRGPEHDICRVPAHHIPAAGVHKGSHVNTETNSEKRTKGRNEKFTEEVSQVISEHQKAPRLSSEANTSHARQPSRGSRQTTESGRTRKEEPAHTVMSTFVISSKAAGGMCSATLWFRLWMSAFQPQRPTQGSPGRSDISDPNGNFVSIWKLGRKERLWCSINMLVICRNAHTGHAGLKCY